jgi:hypothetical protein
VQDEQPGKKKSSGAGFYPFFSLSAFQQKPKNNPKHFCKVLYFAENRFCNTSAKGAFAESLASLKDKLLSIYY